jgi:uncharacterized coiled-coil DUF342 family protein
VNKKEFGRLLAQLSDELNAEVEAAEQDVKSARELSARISRYFAKSEALLATLNNSESGAHALLKKASDINSEMDVLSSDASEKATLIESSLNRVKEYVVAVESAYNSFNALDARIRDGDTGLEASLNWAESLKAQINEIRVASDAQLALIKKQLESVTEIVDRMMEAYNSFNEIKDKIFNEDEGFEAVFRAAEESKNRISGLENEAKEIHSQINQFRDSAAGNDKEISALRVRSEAKYQKITRAQEESEKIKTNINKVFGALSTSGQASFFKRRAIRLERLSFIWLGLFLALFVTTIFLAGEYISPILDDIKNVSEPNATLNFEAFLLRFGLVTPVAAAAVFCLNQYVKERKLSERYAFKEISSATIEGSLLMLNRALAENSHANKDEKIIETAIKTVDCIYREPVEPQKTSLLFEFKNKLLGVNAQVKDVLGDIKEGVDNISKKTSGQNELVAVAKVKK